MTVFCGMRGDQVICLHIADRKRSSLPFDYPIGSSTLQRLACDPYWACEFTVRGWEVSSTLINEFHIDIRAFWFKTPRWLQTEPKHLNRYCTYRYQSRTESGLLGQRTLWPSGHMWCHRVHPLTDQPPAQDFSLFADQAVDRHLDLSSLPVVNVTRVGVRIWRPKCTIRVV